MYRNVSGHKQFIAMLDIKTKYIGMECASYTQRAPTPAVPQPLYTATLQHPQTPPYIAR